MTAGRIVVYIVAAIAFIAAVILLLFGILYIWSAFGTEFNSGWLTTGLITVVIGIIFVTIGFGMIWFGDRLKKKALAEQNVTVNIDLPANVDLDKFKCETCGGELSTDNVELVAGAPVLTCPYCGTTYQLKEDPKW